MYDMISTVPKRMGRHVGVRRGGCGGVETHIKIKSGIKEIHQNVNRGSWIVGFNSSFYPFQYVSIFL